jgi:hypothetical protein
VKEAAAAGVAAAATNSGEEKEVERAGGEQSAEYNVGETDADKAAKAAEVADGSAGPAKEKEEEEESDAVPGSGAKEDTAAGGGSSGGKQDVAGVDGSGIKDALREEIAVVSKSVVEGDDGKKAMEEIPGPVQGKVLLSGTRWSFVGDSWTDLSNGLNVCYAIADLRHGVKWTRGQTVIVQHANVRDPHRGIVVAVGRCSNKPYLVLYTGTHFEQAPIAKDMQLDAGAHAVDGAEVEQLWSRFCVERAVSEVKWPKVANKARVEKPQRVQPPRAAKGEGAGKKRSARKGPAKKMARRKVVAVDEEAKAASDDEEEEEEEEEPDVSSQKKAKQQRRARSEKPKRNTSKPMWWEP